MGASGNHLLPTLSYRRGHPSSEFPLGRAGEVSQLPHSFVHSLIDGVMSFIHAVIHWSKA